MSSLYKIRKGTTLVTVCGEHLLVSTAPPEEGKVYIRQLNESGKVFWDFIEKYPDYEDIVAAVKNHYNEPEEKVRKVLDGFLEELFNSGYMTKGDGNDF